MSSGNYIKTQIANFSYADKEYYSRGREDYVPSEEQKELERKYRKSKVGELELLPYDVLRKISLFKKPNYCATALALKAQGILHRRNPIGPSASSWTRNHSAL